MNRSILMLALMSCAALGASASAIAAQPLPTVRQTVAWLEQRLGPMGGEVAAIEFDEGGDKAAHYHVIMKFPNGHTPIDVDAATGEFSAHVGDSAAMAGVISLADAAARANATVPGRVLNARLDATSGTTPHYDVDVLLPTERVALVKVDAKTGALGWRHPIIEPR